MSNTTTRLWAVIAVFIFCLSHIQAQNMNVTNSAPITPENLISNVFLGDGVEVVSISYQGDDEAVGLFTNGMANIGMERGIVMTTGKAVSAPGQVGVDSPGNAQAAEPNSSNLPDPDLQDIVGSGTLNDLSRYVIEFRPTNDTLRFTYSFASEEYPEFACSQYNDVFGFFISGPGISGPYENNAANIALVPGTDRPVTINNINPGVVGASGSLANCQGDAGSLAYSEYYNANNTATTFPVYDGFTDVLIAEAVVQPCSLYRIKLVIADMNDGSHDSAVFLEAKSFGTGSLDVEIEGLAVDGGLAEGCGAGEIAFKLPNPAESDYDIMMEVGGTATPGVDYPAFPTDVIIPAGDSIFTIPLIAYQDDLVEGDETIEVSVQIDPCNRDTFIIVIKDDILIKPDLGPDVVVCPTDDTPLDGTVPVPLPEPAVFQSTQAVDIDPHNTAFVSEIDVFGVLPINLTEETILSICIDSLEHRWIDDLDIYVVAPGGQFLELSTDNGLDGGNGLGVDIMDDLCFTISATELITTFNDNPSALMTGNYQPEGVWSDLWDGDNPTNGTWQLIITDDTNGLVGTLHSWSITFNPVYQVFYNWAPSEGLSCDNCPDPIASPDTTTSYILTVSDSYGCEKKDTINFEVLEALEMEGVVCGTSTTSSVQAVWPPLTGATGYEVSVNGGAWMPASGPLEHIVNGLGLLEDVEIIVRALGNQCPSIPDTITCTSLDCTPAVFSETHTDVSCNGGMDGSIEVVVSSGTPPFTFTLGMTTNNTGVFDNLTAGAYTVEVEDGLGCTGTAAITINEPPAPTFTDVLVTRISCNGYTDGALTVSIADGNGPYMFNWSNMSTDSIATNLGAGTYTVTLTDSQGCMFTEELSIDEPDPLTSTINGTDALCAGANDGQAWVTATGGTAPYTYAWNDMQMQDTAFALVAGTYTVTVTDDFGCTTTTDVTIDEPAALVINNPVENAATCFGTSTGSLGVDVAGGTMPYTYIWQDAAGVDLPDDQATASNLAAGTYTVLVIDANDCSTSMDLTVTEPDELILQDLQTEIPSCVSYDDGTATVDAIGGTMPYSFTWDSGETGANATNLAASNDHWVAVEDANNCVDTLFFSLNDPVGLTLDLSAQDVSCFAYTDGSATAMVTGGSTPYSYTWTTSTATTATAPDLAAGTYTVEIRDANNCLITDMIEVGSPDALELVLTPDDPNCFMATDGNILAAVDGGTAPYTYQWNDAAAQTVNPAVNLAAQTYMLTVTDANNCTITETATLDEPQELTATDNMQEQACTGPPNGQAGVVPTGGTPPYSYAWSNGQDTQTATGLTAGSHTVTITDSQLCTYTTTIDVTLAESVAIVDFTNTDVSCFGGSDATVSVNLTGGTAPYTWSQPLTGLQAGSYSLTVTDANQCTDELQVDITEPAELVLSTAVTNVDCYGDQTGALDLAVSGGVVDYDYNWSNGVETEDLSSLPAGDYTVTVTDANNCVAIQQSTIQESEILSIISETKDVGCFAASTGQITVEGRGGQAPYSYSWDNGASVADLANLPAGTYTLVLTDALGCDATETYTLTEPTAISASLTSEDVSCFGGRDGVVSITTEGGTPPFTYGYSNDSWQGSPVFVGLFADEYVFQLKDANDCPFTVGSVTINEPVEIAIDMGDDFREIAFGDTLHLTPEVTGDLPIVSYEWLYYDDSWMLCQNCIDQSVFPLYQSDLHLLVTDENGCTATDWIRINVTKNFPVVVPTAFTPNGDFINDELLVHGIEGAMVQSFQVWDRWGELLYATQSDSAYEVNSDSGWDGTYRGEDMDAGVYIWKAEVMLPDGKLELFSGHTTLIR